MSDLGHIFSGTGIAPDLSPPPPPPSPKKKEEEEKKKILDVQEWPKPKDVNCLQHKVQPQPGDGSTGNLNTFVPADSDPWVSPQVDHVILPASSPLPVLPRRYPQRERHPPDQ